MQRKNEGLSVLCDESITHPNFRESFNLNLALGSIMGACALSHRGATLAQIVYIFCNKLTHRLQSLPPVAYSILN